MTSNVEYLVEYRNGYTRNSLHIKGWCHSATVATLAEAEEQLAWIHQCQEQEGRIKTRPAGTATSYPRR